MTYLQNTEREIRILADIVGERIRQEQIGRDKRRAGDDWSTCADPEMPGGDPMRYLVLAEEVGEVARAILERPTIVHLGDPLPDEHLRAELVQVAAVAVAFIEAIDERRAS